MESRILKPVLGGVRIVALSISWSPTNRSYQIELEAIEEERADCFTFIQCIL